MNSTFAQTVLAGVIAAVIAGLILYLLTNTDSGLRLLYTVKPNPGA